MKKIIQKTITLSLLASSLLLASDINIEDLNKQAVDLIKQNNSTQAYTLLEKQYNNGSFDKQTLFLLGTSAKNNNQIDTSIKYFQELLSKDESAQRVRLELAVLYYKKRDLATAKDLLLIVKASNPPKKVGDNIERFLNTIEKGIPRSYSLFANVGFMYDSNANQSTTDDTIIINNTPFELSGDAKETSDSALKYGVGINHIKSFSSSFALQSSAVINIVNYFDLNYLDSSSLSASLAPTWKQNKKTTISLPVIANVIKYGHEDKYYSRSVGIAPQVNYLAQENLSISTSLTLNWKDYYQQPDKELDSITLSPSAKYYIDQSSWLNASAYLSTEDSKTDTESSDIIGMNIAYYKGLSKDLNLYIMASYDKRSYDGTLDLFDTSRDDKTATLSTTVSYFINQIKSNLSLNLSHTNNSSNINYYEYKRNVIGLNLGYRF